MRVCFLPKSVDVQQIKDPINNRRDHTVSEIHGNQRSSEKKRQKRAQKVRSILKNRLECLILIGLMSSKSFHW